MNREDEIEERWHKSGIEADDVDVLWLVEVARKARAENSQIQITDRGTMEFDIRSIGELRKVLKEQ